MGQYDLIRVVGGRGRLHGYLAKDENGREVLVEALQNSLLQRRERI